MKKIFLLIMLLLSSHAALALEMDVHPIAAVGYRPGRYGLFEMGPGAFYMSGKVTTFGHQFEPCTYVNFLSPSISYQDDGQFGYGFSPASVTTDINGFGFTAGMDIIFARKGMNGDIAGFFFGLKF